MQGVAGSYSNIGYMGPPLVLSALGAGASAPVVLIFVCDSLLLFTLVPLLMALAGVERRSFAGDGRARSRWRVRDASVQRRDRGRRSLQRAAARLPDRRSTR